MLNFDYSINSSRIFKHYSLPAAMVFLVLLLANCGDTKTNQPTSLYDQFYQTPPLRLSDQPNTKFCDRAKIEQLIKNQRYQPLWSLLEDCLAENAKDPEILKVKIIALLEANQLQLARATLIKLISHESYFSESIWLTALSWVKEGDHQKAIRVLAQLPDDSDYLGRARLLTKKLTAAQKNPAKTIEN